jgi:hypothetical protein
MYQALVKNNKGDFIQNYYDRGQRFKKNNSVKQKDKRDF